MEILDIKAQTKAMIDSLKAVCTTYGLGNASSEYKIITEIFLYKYLNDKFIFEMRKANSAWHGMTDADVETQLNSLSDDDYEMALFDIGGSTAKLMRNQFISYLFNRQNEEDFHKLFDQTLLDIANQNMDIFSVQAGGSSKIRLFDALSPYVIEAEKRDAFCRAMINADVSVRFKYFDYDVNMERVFRRRGGWYEVSPLLLVYSDDNYYLVGCDHKDGKVRNFRVDRMAHLNGTGHPRMGKELFTKEDLGLYQRYSFNMYNGTVEEVTMRFRNNMMNAVVDKFGRQNFVNPVDKDHFEITVPVAVSPQFFGWVFGLGNYVTIVGPEWVKDKMVETLEKVRKRYPED